MTNGPMTAFVLTEGPGWEKYLGGVMQGGPYDDKTRRAIYRIPDSEKLKDVNHAVTLIGWGSQHGIPYWLAQNSWGKGWGEDGFFKIERGKNALNFELTPFLSSYPDVVNLACQGPAHPKKV